LKRRVAESRAALSDVSFHIEDMIAEEDKVVVRGTYSAIHDRGEWLGMAPTGNRLQPFSKRVNLSERGALSIQSVQKA
jgi:predicted ester cyclase